MKKTAIITASGKGIGAGIARRLAADGYAVGLLGRSSDVEKLAAELGGFAVRGDVTREEDINRLVDLARERTGRIDAVIANTGHAPKKPALELTDADWHLSLDIVLLPFIRLARSTFADLAKSGGSLVAVSSSAAVRPDPVFVVSSALRAALSSYVRLLARDWAEKGINVNAIAPGFVDSLPSTAERIARIPAGRYARVEEIGEAVAYLLSPSARYVTGQTLVIDGALTA